jgi:hypothetical protein
MRKKGANLRLQWQPMTALASFALCADDFALSPAVTHGILEALAAGRLTATSAMTTQGNWPDAAKAVHALRPDADLGLHFNLTLGGPLWKMPSFAPDGAFPAMNAIVPAAWRSALPRQEIRDELRRQLDAFEDAHGAPPDYVDGHQHVHQLPGVRQALADTLSRRYDDQAVSIAVRCCVSTCWRGSKAALIGALGGRALRRLSARRGWMANSDFVGVYDFAESADLPRLWADWLTGLDGGLTLAMCHVAAPGHPHDPGDPIHAARLREFAWLKSHAFHELCERHGVAPTRWPAAAPTP